MAKIVILDSYHINPGDLRWDPFNNLGDLDIHEFTEDSEVVDRCKNAEIVLSNKVLLKEKHIQKLPDLKCICVMATGYNNIDIEACKARNIIVCNIPAYSTDSVAQYVFAGILEVTNKLSEYHKEIRAGRWQEINDWSYSRETMFDIAGKTLGVLGFGKIGQRVAEIGLAFGMKVISYHKHPKRDKMEGVEFVDLEYLFANSDYLSLHVPLNPSSHHIVNKSTLELMKSDAILINTGRGPLINEADLAEYLKSYKIKGAILDVLSNEPPEKDNPLTGLDNCYITPHIAWANIEARQRLMNILLENVKAYLIGSAQNRII